MRRRLFVVAAASALAAIGVFACGDDDDSGVKTPDSGTQPQPEASIPDTSVPPPKPDSSTTDAGVDSSIVPKVLATFNATVGENPDGIALLPAATGGLVVGLAKTGNIVSILGDGGTQQYATFGFPQINQGGAVNSVWISGLANDAAGNLYASITTQGPPLTTPPPVWTPAPGVYKIPPGGGAPVLFAVNVAMKNPQGLVFVGTDLFISDTTGKIFKADAAGVTTVWSTDAELVGDLAACPTPIPTVVGVSGLAKDATNIYAVNLQKGSLLKIPVDPDGGVAGTPVVIKKDCPTLGGANGVIIDTDGTFLVGVAAKNTIQRVTPLGVVTPVLTGKPLDGPTKMVLDGRKLLIANPALGTSAANPAAAAPSVISYELNP